MLTEKQVELQPQSYETTIRAFGTNIATASVANIFGQISGHPLDTIRVSNSNYKKFKFICNMVGLGPNAGRVRKPNCNQYSYDNTQRRGGK